MTDIPDYTNNSCCSCGQIMMYRRRDMVCDECREKMQQKENEVNWKNGPFKPEDFEKVLELECFPTRQAYPFWQDDVLRDCAELANRRFQELRKAGLIFTKEDIENCPRVLLKWNAPRDYETVLEVSLATHQARLICIEELNK